MNYQDMCTIQALVSAILILTCVLFQMVQVMQVFARARHHTFRAISHKVGQQQQRLHSTEQHNKMLKKYLLIHTYHLSYL